MENDNEFWHILEHHWHDEAGTDSASLLRAGEILGHYVPGGTMWKIHDHISTSYAFTELLGGIAFDATCKLQENIRVPLSWIRYCDQAEDLDALLYSKSQKECQTFLWYVVDGQSDFAVPSCPRQRLASLLKQTLYLDSDGGHRYLYLDAGAICMLEHQLLSVYRLPFDWEERLNGVLLSLRWMNAREQAAKELPSVLKRFVDLLGPDAVDNALNLLFSRQGA